MSVPPELRVTDRDVDLSRRSHHAIIVCPACHGLGVHEGRGVVDDVTCGTCGGGGEIADGIALPPGASARIGAALVGHLPHLRRAVWPSREET